MPAFLPRTPAATTAAAIPPCCRLPDTCHRRCLVPLLPACLPHCWITTGLDMWWQPRGGAFLPADSGLLPPTPHTCLAAIFRDATSSPCSLRLTHCMPTHLPSIPFHGWYALPHLYSYHIPSMDSYLPPAFISHVIGQDTFGVGTYLLFLPSYLVYPHASYLFLV